MVFQRLPHLTLAPPSVSIICASFGVWSATTAGLSWVMYGKTPSLGTGSCWESGFFGFGALTVSGLSSSSKAQSGLGNYFFTAGGCMERRPFKAKEMHLSQLSLSGGVSLPSQWLKSYLHYSRYPASQGKLLLFCKLTCSLLLQLQRLCLHKVLWFAVYKPIKKTQMKSPAGKVKSNEVGCCEEW